MFLREFRAASCASFLNVVDLQESRDSRVMAGHTCDFPDLLVREFWVGSHHAYNMSLVGL